VVPPAYYVQLAADRGQILAQGKSCWENTGQQQQQLAARAAVLRARCSSNPEGAAAAAAVGGQESVGGAATPGLIVRVCMPYTVCGWGQHHATSGMCRGQLHWFCPVAASGCGGTSRARCWLLLLSNKGCWPEASIPVIRLASCCAVGVVLMQSTQQQLFSRWSHTVPVRGAQHACDCQTLRGS